MNAKTPSYHGHRFPPEIISHAVWLYYRLGRHLLRSANHRILRERSILVWHEVTCA